MPISTRAKLDLVTTDTRPIWAANEAPQPEDDYLNFRLGQDYEQYEKMRRDSHIHSRLQRRRLAVLGRRMIVKPGGPTELDRQAAEFVAGLIGLEDDAAEDEATPSKEGSQNSILINYDQICNDLLDSGMLIGFSAVAYDWERMDNRLVPVNFRFVPQYRMNFAYYQEKNYEVPVATGERLMIYKNAIKKQIAMQNGYEVRLLTKRSPLSGERIPKGRILAYSFGSSQGLPWGRGLGYQFWPWWKIKTEARNAWLLHSDRLGSPPILGTYDVEGSGVNGNPGVNLASQSHRETLREFDEFLKAVSPNGYGSFPSYFKAQLIEALNSTSPDVHERLIKTCDMQMTEAALGEVSFDERPTGGSYAATETQKEDRETNLTDADCNLLDGQLREFLWKPLIELNFPNAAIPVVKRWTTEEDREVREEQQKELARRDRASSDEILITKLGLIPTQEYITETYGEEWSLPPAVEQIQAVLEPAKQPEQRALPEAEPESEPRQDDLAEWPNLRRAQLAAGHFRGGFAGPALTYPISTSYQLPHIWDLAETDDIRGNIIAIAQRFDWTDGLPIEARQWANSQGIRLANAEDFGQVSRIVTWQGLKIGLECEVGQERFGKPMRIAYGHFRNHVGNDGEATDVYIGPHFSSDRLFRIAQLTQEGEFDEYKYGILFETAQQFERAYKRQMPAKLFGGIDEVGIEDVQVQAKPSNVVSFQEKKGGGSRVQTILFPVNWNQAQVVGWLKRNKFKASKVLKEGNRWRARQFDPSDGKNYRTITLDRDRNVKAVVEFSGVEPNFVPPDAVVENLTHPKAGVAALGFAEYVENGRSLSFGNLLELSCWFSEHSMDRTPARDWLAHGGKAALQWVTVELAGMESEDFAEQVWGVWFGGRRTPIVVRAASRSEAISKARKKKRRGGDNVASTRVLKGSELSAASRGDWVRSGPQGESPGKSNLRGYGPKPKDHAEPIQVTGDILDDDEFDAIAEDQKAAFKDAGKGWKQVAPEEFRRLLDAG